MKVTQGLEAFGLKGKGDKRAVEINQESNIRNRLLKKREIVEISPARAGYVQHANLS